MSIKKASILLSSGINDEAADLDLNIRPAFTRFGIQLSGQKHTGTLWMHVLNN